MKLYAKIDADGNLELPIRTTNKACGKQVRCSYVRDEKDDTKRIPVAIDPELYAKAQFGKKFKEVEFDDAYPIGCFTDNQGEHHCFYTGKVIDGVAEVDPDTVVLRSIAVAESSAQTQRSVWVKQIHKAIDVAAKANWTMAEEKIAIGQIPTDAEFEVHDSTFKFN